MKISGGEIVINLGIIDFLGQRVNLDQVFHTLDESKKGEIIAKTNENFGITLEYGPKSNIVKINGIILTATDIFGAEKAQMLQAQSEQNSKCNKLNDDDGDEQKNQEQELIRKEAEKLKKMHVSFNGKLCYLGDEGNLKQCEYHTLSDKDRKIVLVEKYKNEAAQVLYSLTRIDNYESPLFKRIFIPAENCKGIFSVTKLVNMASHDDIAKILANPKDERSFMGRDFILNGVTFPQEEQDFVLITETS